MFGSSGNSFQRNYPVIFNLIALNVVIWIAQITLKQFDLTGIGSLHYFKTENFKPFQIVTSFFMHSPSGPHHLLFNMISLYFFGTMLERAWGSKRFFIFYMACGVGASVLTQVTIPFSVDQIWNQVASTIPDITDELKNSIEYKTQMNAYKAELLNDYSMLGASGAIMGVLAAAAYLFPNTPVLLMFIPIPIKLKWLTLLYVAYDLFGGFKKIEGDNVAHFAHLGGALVGFLLVFFWNKTNKKTFY